MAAALIDYTEAQVANSEKVKAITDAAGASAASLFAAWKAKFGVTHADPYPPQIAVPVPPGGGTGATGATGVAEPPTGATGATGTGT
jgi:hypothetical protein